MNCGGEREITDSAEGNGNDQIFDNQGHDWINDGAAMTTASTQARAMMRSAEAAQELMFSTAAMATTPSLAIQKPASSQMGLKATPSVF